MIGLASRSQVFAYAKPTDLRKSFYALAELVRLEMDRDPLCGDAFLFVNRRRTMTKCLVYDGTGMRLTIKRLTKGRFAAPWLRDDDVVAMTAAELSLFFEGSPFVFAGALSPRPIGTSSVVGRSLSVQNSSCVIDLDRTRDPEVLRQVAKIQDAELRRVQQQMLALKRENEALKGGTPDEIAERLAEFERQLTQGYTSSYSTGSERRSRGTPPKKAKTKQKGHGPTPQPELLQEVVEHDLDDADKVCPTCGLDLVEFEGQYAESEEVDVVGLQYVLKKHRRKKYRCQCGCTVETAEPPARLIPGGRYSTEFAVHVAADKYDGHLPLERQARRMRRSGLTVTSQTLWDQTWALAGCFRDAIDRLHTYLLSKELLLADESRWPLLGAKGRKTKNWFAWTLASEDAILHRIEDTRSNEACRSLLTGFRGVLVTDGYVVYKSLATEIGYVQAHCWSHARRKFIEAEPSATDLSATFLDDIGELFGIERTLAERTLDLPPVEAVRLREQVRDEQSRAIVNRIGRRAMEAKVLPRSPIAQAIKYLENRWDGLVRFVDDGRVPMTSNAAERALRGLVLGRSNHFGSRSQRGTEVAAIFYSLIESAKLNDLDPIAYLRTAAAAHMADQTVPLPHELA